MSPTISTVRSSRGLRHSADVILNRHKQSDKWQVVQVASDLGVAGTTWIATPLLQHLRAPFLITGSPLVFHNVSYYYYNSLSSGKCAAGTEITFSTSITTTGINIPNGRWRRYLRGQRWVGGVLLCPTWSIFTFRGMSKCHDGEKPLSRDSSQSISQSTGCI